MSNAWNDLVNADGSDEWLKLCNTALTEVQAETRAREARRILSENPDRDADFSAGVDWAVSVLNREETP